MTPEIMEAHEELMRAKVWHDATQKMSQAAWQTNHDAACVEEAAGRKFRDLLEQWQASELEKRRVP